MLSGCVFERNPDALNDLRFEVFATSVMTFLCEYSESCSTACVHLFQPLIIRSDTDHGTSYFLMVNVFVESVSNHHMDLNPEPTVTERKHQVESRHRKWEITHSSCAAAAVTSQRCNRIQASLFYLNRFYLFSFTVFPPRFKYCRHKGRERSLLPWNEIFL